MNHSTRILIEQNLASQSFICNKFVWTPVGAVVLFSHHSLIGFHCVSTCQKSEILSIFMGKEEAYPEFSFTAEGKDKKIFKIFKKDLI